MYLVNELEPPVAVDNDRAVFLREAVAGLGGAPKTLPCKYFYDERGSKLFDAICELEEYYPTRTELAIMRAHVGEIASMFAPGDALVELGSGSSLKTRLLLDRLPDLAAYVPVDISTSHLSAAAAELRGLYPSLRVLPVAADYTKRFAIPMGGAERVTVYFPGSTIGNFHPGEAVAFMRQIRQLCGVDGRLLIGVDLRKDTDVLEAAYNDAQGVTADFNLNVLTRLRRELDADCDLDGFVHQAFFNTTEGRIEMHLVSVRAQRITLGGHSFHFEPGETIWTECSYKHTLDSFAELAAHAGFLVERVWTDPKQWFSVQLLRAL